MLVELSLTQRDSYRVLVVHRKRDCALHRFWKLVLIKSEISFDFESCLAPLKRTFRGFLSVVLGSHFPVIQHLSVNTVSWLPADLPNCIPPNYDHIYGRLHHQLITHAALLCTVGLGHCHKAGLLVGCEILDGLLEPRGGPLRKKDVGLTRESLQGTSRLPLKHGLDSVWVERHDIYCANSDS